MITHLVTRRHLLGVHDRASYREWQGRALQAQRDRLGVVITLHQIDSPIVASVNHGRWIAECVGCLSGMAADPEMPECRCIECGAVYPVVRFPEDRAALERLLVRRPRVGTRNWVPGETVEMLAAENLEHGVP